MDAPTGSSGSSTGVFISYRREDTSGYAGRLYDSLRARIGGGVFMDIDAIEPGLDFVEAIEGAMQRCTVVLALIGDRWLAVRDAQGRTRLDNAGDFVRLELETALRADKRVIPVLVHDATMPSEEQLPESLRALARRHAIELSDARWSTDIDRLASVLERVLTRPDLDVAPPAPTPIEDVPAAVAAAEQAAATAIQAAEAKSPEAQAPERRRRLWPIAAVVAVVLAVGGVAIAMAGGGGGETSSSSTSTPSSPATSSGARVNLAAADLEGSWAVDLTMRELTNWDAADTDIPIWTFTVPPAEGDSATDAWHLGSCSGDPCVMTFTSEDRPGRFETGFERDGVAFGAHERADSPCGKETVQGMRSMALEVAAAKGGRATEFDGTFAIRWKCPGGEVSASMDVHGTRTG
jgi:TIR domain